MKERGQTPKPSRIGGEGLKSSSYNDSLIMATVLVVSIITGLLIGILSK